MSRRYYRRRSRDSDGNGIGILVVAVALVVLVGYMKLSPQVFQLLLAGILLIAAIVILSVMYAHFRRSVHEQQKQQALSMADVNAMDRLEFEKYVAQLLKSQGYTNVTLTERYDYGVDIISVRDGIRWGVQVKRYGDLVKAAAVRQVVTALNHYKCQRAMVVTNSVFSRPAKSLAASNNCTLVDHEILSEWIFQFQRRSIT